VTARKKAGDGGRRTDARTAAEWGLFGIAALLVAAVVAILVLDWANGASDPAAFRTTLRPAVAAEGGHQVPVEIENSGGQAAAEIVVRAELEIDGEVVEAEETVDFLAGGERTEVTFVFAHDPATGGLTVQVASYREP